jgi:hypothetical protein
MASGFGFMGFEGKLGSFGDFCLWDLKGGGGAGWRGPFASAIRTQLELVDSREPVVTRRFECGMASGFPFMGFEGKLGSFGIFCFWLSGAAAVRVMRVPFAFRNSTAARLARGAPRGRDWQERK